MTYCAAGFVDKNNDLLFRDLSQCMYACGHPLAQSLFPEGKSDQGFVLLDSTVSKYMYQEPSTSGLTYLRDSITEVNYFQLHAIKLNVIGE